MARTDTTRLVLLGLLEHEPASGYDLRRLIGVRLSAFWKAGYAQIYPALARLERDGLVSVTVEQSAKRQPKKVFALTEAGRGALEDAVRSFAPNPEMKADFLLKIFFGARAPREQILALLRELEAHHRGALERFARHEQQLEAALSQEGDQDHLFYLLALQLGQKLSVATAEWAAGATKRLGSIAVQSLVSRSAQASTAGPRRKSKVAHARSKGVKK